MSLPWEGRFAVKVYYEDTDALGIVYYANYLKYMERGRSELFAQTRHTMLEWNQSGHNFAVAKVNLTFHAPARLGDCCEVLTRRLTSRSPYRLQLHQQILRGPTLLVDAMVHVVCLDHHLALREFPEEWIDELMSEPPVAS